MIFTIFYNNSSFQEFQMKKFHNLKSKKILLWIAFLLVVFVSVIYFVFLSSQKNKTTTYTNNTQYEFDTYTKELFSSSLSEDYLSMHFYLDHPEDYNIKSDSPTLGDYSYKSMKTSQTYYINQINYLKTIDYSKLYNSQKLTYDTLMSSFKTQLDFSDLCLCSEVLSPTTGLQAQLPVLFSEYSFNCSKDIDIYLKLLSQLKDYYGQICEFQKLKAKNNCFISSFCCEKIINQCKEFIGNKSAKDNILYTSFKTRLQSVDFISNRQKEQYINQNERIILNSIYPGYENIIVTLTDLNQKGFCKNDGGLSNIKNGREYYEYLVKSYTGSSRNVLEIKALIQEQLAKDMRTMYSLLNVNPELQKQFEQKEERNDNVKNSLDILIKKASKDFTIKNHYNYSIKYVDKSLENYLSPAFYLAPPIDSSNRNCIYINNSSKNNGQNLFSTIAHEGVPGHMYQSDFFASTNPMPIRHIVNFGGYSEGWATYAELFSYKYQYNNEQLANLFSCNTSFSLALYSLCDIGINYEGWNRSKTYKFLNNYGVEDTEVQKSIYEAVIEEPANYLQYYVGYLEIINLRNDLMKNIGADFKIKKFHDAFLTMGPTSFDVARKWIKHFYNLSSD